MRKILLSTALLIAITVTGCKNQEEGKNADLGKQIHQMEKNYVDVMELKKATFMKQILCNGRLEASKKAELSFGVAGKIAKLSIAEGERVKKGELLAELDRENSKMDLEAAKLSYQNAELELENRLLDFGYSIDDRSKIPDEVYKVAALRSGYAAAENNLKRAEKAYADGVIVAPFNGKVASIEAAIHETPKDKICTLLDDSELTVKFTVLESELQLIKKGQKVKIIPFNDQKKVFEAKLETINPMIEKNGQVRLTAKMDNSKAHLIDGQNVKIIIEEAMKDQLVVPKSAVVLRDNHDVLFKYVDGKTVWTYVNIVMANSSSYIIAPNVERNSSIEVGDMIITSGNLNVGDNTDVEINK